MGGIRPVYELGIPLSPQTRVGLVGFPFPRTSVVPITGGRLRVGTGIFPADRVHADLGKQKATGEELPVDQPLVLPLHRWPGLPFATESVPHTHTFREWLA